MSKLKSTKSSLSKVGMHDYQPSPNPRPWLASDRKEPEFYKNLRIKADSYLHEQLSDFLATLRTDAPAHGGKHRVLDWGCGEGALSQRLHDDGCEVVAVDMDEQQFKAQGPTFQKINFNRPDEVAAFIDNNTGTFDIILAVEIIEHVHDPWAFLENLKQLCGPHTHLVVTTPNISHWWARFWFLLTGDIWGFTPEGWDDPGHINSMTRTEVLGILRDTGLECRQVWLGGCLPIIWTYNWKRLLISLMMLPVRLVMKGDRDGFNLCYHVQLKS